MKQKNITARQIKNLLSALKNNSAIAEKLNSPTDKLASAEQNYSTYWKSPIVAREKISLPTKGGVKEYQSIKLASGKVGVFVQGWKFVQKWN